MDSIRVVVVDDENLARQRIRRLMTDFPDMQIVDECGDGESAVKSVRKNRPDLLFLDVRMPGMDGFAVLDSLEPELIPVTIFVTAYDQYALKAFEAQAIDFLLKPFDRERFGKAVERARQYLSPMVMICEIALCLC